MRCSTGSSARGSSIRSPGGLVGWSQRRYASACGGIADPPLLPRRVALKLCFLRAKGLRGRFDLAPGAKIPETTTDALDQRDAGRPRPSSLSLAASESRRHLRALRWVLAARGLRAFGDGFVSLLLPLYLLSLGYSPVDVGIIATATLLGSGTLTLAL